MLLSGLNAGAESPASMQALGFVVVVGLCGFYCLFVCF